MKPIKALELYFADWSRFEKAWLVAFGAIAVGVSLARGGTLLGLVAAVTGMLTVVLVAKGRISNFYFGIVNTVAYAAIAYGSQFYGEVMLNLLYFLPMQFVGLYLWSANPLSGAVDSVEVRSLSNRRRVAWATVAAVAILGYAVVLRSLGGSLPLFDSTSTVLSVLAQYLMVRRVAEQWAAWLTVDGVTIYMWSSTYLADGTGLAMVVMWSAFFVNACYGYYNWTQMERARVSEPADGERARAGEPA